MGWITSMLNPSFDCDKEWESYHPNIIIAKKNKYRDQIVEFYLYSNNFKVHWHGVYIEIIGAYLDYYSNSREAKQLMDLIGKSKCCRYRTRL